MLKHCTSGITSSYFHNVGQTKNTWKGINSILSKAKNTANTTKIFIDETGISDPEAISKAFNKHFTDIGQKVAAQIASSDNTNLDHIQHCNDEFELHKVSRLQVSRLIDKLSIRKSSGLDNISASLLKLSAPTTIESLTHIINLVMRTG